MDKTQTDLETSIKGLRFDFQRLNDLADSGLIRRPIRTIASGVALGSLVLGVLGLVAGIVLSGLGV